MSSSRNSRPVYSTGPRPVDEEELRKEQQAPGSMEEVVLRMERSGRGGKTVTVVEMRNFNESDTIKTAKELKCQLGTGGTIKDNTIEVQGEQRDRVRAFFVKKRIKVKG